MTDCAGSLGLDVLAQDVAALPETTVPACGWFLFPPSPYGGARGEAPGRKPRARGVVQVPDIKAYWHPLVQLAAVRSLEVTPRGATGSFEWPTPPGCCWRGSARDGL